MLNLWHKAGHQIAALWKSLWMEKAAFFRNQMCKNPAEKFPAGFLLLNTVKGCALNGRAFMGPAA